MLWRKPCCRQFTIHSQEHLWGRTPMLLVFQFIPKEWGWRRGQGSAQDSQAVPENHVFHGPRKGIVRLRQQRAHPKSCHKVGYTLLSKMSLHVAALNKFSSDLAMRWHKVEGLVRDRLKSFPYQSSRDWDISWLLVSTVARPYISHNATWEQISLNCHCPANAHISQTPLLLFVLKALSKKKSLPAFRELI